MEFGSTVRDTFKTEPIGYVIAGALVMALLLLVPYVGVWLGLVGLVFGAWLYQDLIRNCGPTPHPVEGSEAEQEGWVNDAGHWALSVLGAVGLTAPFLARGAGDYLPLIVTRSLQVIGFACWVIVPVVLLLANARDRLGPVPPRLVLKTLARHWVTTLLALSIIPVGFCLIEALLLLISVGEDQLPLMINDLFPPPKLDFRDDRTFMIYNYDTGQMEMLLSRTSDEMLPVYRFALSKGYTLVGSIPASLSRGVASRFDPTIFITADVMYLGYRICLAMVILTIAGVLLSVQARWLGLIPLIGTFRPVGAAAHPSAPAQSHPTHSATPPEPAVAARPIAAPPRPVAVPVRPAVSRPSLHPAPGAPMPNVLIIDGDRGFAVALGRILSGRGFAVLLATSAEEGQALAHGANPDVVVLDTMLPDRSGLELCREFRDGGPPGTRPILIATSQTVTSEEISGMARWADDYMVKPYVIDALINRMNQHLQNRPKPAGT
jgi:CheY-like chemotaxis protein